MIERNYDNLPIPPGNPPGWSGTRDPICSVKPRKAPVEHSRTGSGWVVGGVEQDGLGFGADIPVNAGPGEVVHEHPATPMDR